MMGAAEEPPHSTADGIYIAYIAKQNWIGGVGETAMSPRRTKSGGKRKRPHASAAAARKHTFEAAVCASYHKPGQPRRHSRGCSTAAQVREERGIYVQVRRNDDDQPK